ncbi:uncharacterized protein LOC116247224 [Nymphaea colorata]|nr:uncharacterized protein LOC116247224 [Nymphaea colorata]
MLGVIQKFFLVSAIMWIAPLVILYGFNHQIFPGISELSASSQTLLSGFLAVISVNFMIGIYIFMAMREPLHGEHKPDASFLAQAKASINQSSPEIHSHLQDSKKED